MYKASVALLILTASTAHAGDITPKRLPDGLYLLQAWYAPGTTQVCFVSDSGERVCAAPTPPGAPSVSSIALPLGEGEVWRAIAVYAEGESEPSADRYVGPASVLEAPVVLGLGQ